MPTPTNDRRIRRTRQLLHAALLELIQEQPYHTITVQDILDRADIGRSTFYTHFRDKDDLFDYGINRMLDALGRHFDEQVPDDGSGPVFPSLALFRHVQEHQHLYQALLRGQGLEMLFKRGQAALTRRIEQHLQSHAPAQAELPIPIPLLATYLAGAMLTLLQWWLDNHTPYTPERMDEIYRQLAIPGVAQLFLG